LIKSLIDKIKEQIFWQVQIDEIEKKMSKIKKKLLKQGILEQKNISHMYIFLEELLEISRIRW